MDLFKTIHQDEEKSKQLRGLGFFVLIVSSSIAYTVWKSRLLRNNAHRIVEVENETQGHVDQEHQQQQRTQPEVPQSLFNDDDQDCPICLERTPNEMIYTSCRHVFCESCFDSLWRNRFGGNARCVTCPMCRQLVTTIFPINASNSVSQRVADYNASNDIDTGSGAATCAAIWDAIHCIPQACQESPLLARYFITTILRNPQLIVTFGFFLLNSYRFILIFCGVWMYCILPFDLLPESSLGYFGLLDDWIVQCVLLMVIMGMFRSFALTSTSRGT